jgi:hypothetical protein
MKTSKTVTKKTAVFPKSEPAPVFVTPGIPAELSGATERTTPLAVPAATEAAPAYETAGTIKAERLRLLAAPEGATREALIRVSARGRELRRAGKDADSGLPGLRKAGFRIEKRNVGGEVRFYLSVGDGGSGGDYVTRKGRGNLPVLPGS